MVKKTLCTQRFRCRSNDGDTPAIYAQDDAKAKEEAKAIQDVRYIAPSKRVEKN